MHAITKCGYHHGNKTRDVLNDLVIGILRYGGSEKKFNYPRQRSDTSLKNTINNNCPFSLNKSRYTLFAKNMKYTYIAKDYY